MLRKIKGILLLTPLSILIAKMFAELGYAAFGLLQSSLVAAGLIVMAIYGIYLLFT